MWLEIELMLGWERPMQIMIQLFYFLYFEVSRQRLRCNMLGLHEREEKRNCLKCFPQSHIMGQNRPDTLRRIAICFPEKSNSINLMRFEDLGNMRVNYDFRLIRSAPKIYNDFLI